MWFRWLAFCPPWLLALVFLGLMFMTGSKLSGMAQIRGWTDGAETVQVPIVARGEGKASPWVDVKSLTGQKRVWVSEERFPSLSVGTMLEAKRLKGGLDLYVADGPYASNGQFWFDGFLMVLWITGFAWNVIRQLQRRVLKR